MIDRIITIIIALLLLALIFTSCKKEPNIRDWTCKTEYSYTGGTLTEPKEPVYKEVKGLTEAEIREYEKKHTINWVWHNAVKVEEVTTCY